MELLRRGHYSARLASSAQDLRRSQGLRHLCFHGVDGIDCDDFDASCQHVLIEDAASGALVCCYRLLVLKHGAEISQSYSAQYYDLSRLAGFPGPVVEMGRFCTQPGQRDPDILRLAWGAMTRIVDDSGAGLLFGCASFAGTDWSTHADAFALLRAEHLAPKCWQPGEKAAQIFPYADALNTALPDQRRGLLGMPPLLRTYLSMGGWVSDHAVIDAQMNTMHVFTGVEINAIPAARARALRMVAAG